MKAGSVVLIAVGSLFVSNAIAQKDMPAYRIFSGEGKEVKWHKIVKSLPEEGVVFFGELHNDPVSHWLELKVTEEIFAMKGTNMTAGAEMFETDQQLILTEYVSGLIDAARFEQGTHLWKNYSTDYKPLVDLARDSGFNFVATNIPRRYANLVSKHGFEILDSLDPEAKKLIAPLPFPYDPEVPAYKKMSEMSMGHGKPNPNLPKAQAAKDATMAHFILENLVDGHSFIHYEGAYHSDFYDGIIWYLKQWKPDVDVLTLSTVMQDDIDKLDEDNLGRADFIFVVPADMTRTY